MSSYTKEQLEQLLFDVVDELDLSDGMIEKHGPHGTPPAVMVREVLDAKDREIFLLRRGFVDVAEIAALRQQLEAQTNRGDALAEAIIALREVVTTDHETKAEFITRIRGILAADPDARVSSLRQQLEDAQADVWILMGNHKEDLVAIHGADGYIACGLAPKQGAAIIKAHNKGRNLPATAASK